MSTDSSKSNPGHRELAERILREFLVPEDVPDVIARIPEDVVERLLAGEANNEDLSKLDVMAADDPELLQAVSMLRNVSEPAGSGEPIANMDSPVFLPTPVSGSETVDWEAEWQSCRKQLVKYRKWPVRIAAAVPERNRYKSPIFLSCVISLASLLLIAAISYSTSRGLHRELGELQAGLSKAQSDNAMLQSQLQDWLDFRNASAMEMTARLEAAEYREFFDMLMANWGDSSEEGIRFAATAHKIHQLEVNQYIPTIFANGTESFWFDQVVRRYASGIALNTDSLLIPINGQQYPDSSDDQANSKRTAYFYGVWAENTLRRILRVPDGSHVDEATRDVLLQLLRLNKGDSWPDEAWEHLAKDRQYVVAQVDVSASDHMQGDVVFTVVDTKAQTVRRNIHSFSGSFSPKPVRKLFGNPDHKSHDDISVRAGTTGDEFIVTFPPSDLPAPQVSFLTYDDHGFKVSRDEFGTAFAYLCFEARVASEGNSTPAISFATGGDDAVKRTAIGARQYGAEWQYVRIPVEVQIGEMWRTGLTITVAGDSAGEPVSIHIRNAYIQPVGGDQSKTPSKTSSA